MLAKIGSKLVEICGFIKINLDLSYTQVSRQVNPQLVTLIRVPKIFLNPMNGYDKNYNFVK